MSGEGSTYIIIDTWRQRRCIYMYNTNLIKAQGSTYEGIFWKRVLRAVDVQWNNTSFNNYDVTI